MTKDSTRQAGAKKELTVEVTPEMVEAGFKVLAGSGITDDLMEADRLLVEEIFRAMLLAESPGGGG